MNIEKINELYSKYDSMLDDTFDVNLGEYGTITLKKHLHNFTVGTMADLIARLVYTGDEYNPSYLQPVLHIVYLLYAVVHDEDREMLKLTDDNFAGNVFRADFIIEKIGLIPAAIKANPELEDALCDVAEAASLRIEAAMKRSNAELASGSATSAAQTLEQLQMFLVSANDALNTIKTQVDMNAKKFSKYLTKKNIDAFLNGLGKDLEGKIDTAIAQHKTVPM